MCFEFAVNLAYRINTETNAVAYVIGLQLLNEHTFNPHLMSDAHAMCLFFTTNGKVYVADQNRPPTEVPIESLNLVKETKVFDDATGAVIELAFHSHLDGVVGRSIEDYHEKKWADDEEMISYHIEKGKRDVMNYFGPRASGFYKMLGHLTNFPEDYCKD